MATLNGSFSGISASRVYPYVTYTSTQNSAANTSSVTVTLVFRSISSYYGYGTCTSTDLYCGGTQSKGSIAFNVAAGGSDTITSTTQTISHDANGNASTTVGANGNTGISWGTFDFSTTYTLPTITRAATVTTGAATSVGQTSATANGTVTDAGIPSCTRGIKWGTVSGTYPNTITSGSGAGAFTASITGLTGGTTYYYKAYATNSTGTVYGDEVSFETTSTTPSVTTSAASSVGSTTATMNGNVTSDGGDTITERGFVHSTTTNPLIGGGGVTKSVVTGTTGSYSKALTGLSGSTTYYFKAYATNANGTTYGSQTTFTTLTATPTVTTSAVDDLLSTTVTLAGNVTSDGGSTVTARGICYALTSSPTTANSKVTVAGTTGAYEGEVTGLSAGSTYYCRAYATNVYGTAYGDNVSFTTLPADPTLLSATTGDKTSVSLTWTKGAGTTYTIVRRATGTYPTDVGDGSDVYSGTGSSTVDTGLDAGTTYYYRAWSLQGEDNYSASYSQDTAVTTADFTNPENVLTDDGDYTTVPANDGVLSCQVSKDGGTTWSISKSLTFDGDTDTLSFGLGTTELWGTTFMGDDMNDGGFMVKLTGGSAGESYQIYKTFGFTIPETYQLTGVQVQVKATYNSSDILLYFVKVDAYYGSSPLPIGEGSLAFDTDYHTPVFYDGSNWEQVLSMNNIDTDLTTVSSEHDTVPSAKAAKAYVDDSKFTWKGPWATSTEYITNDMVENDGSGYVCILGHISGASTEPGVGASWTTNWDLLVEGLPTPNLTTATTTNLTGYLKGDGSVIAAVSGKTLKGITIYTSGSGTYTVPAGVTALYVEVQGGGGGGGGGAGTASNYCGIGSGGGGGGYCAKYLTSLESSYDYAVGAGGDGGAAGANDGSAGGTSTFGTALLSCTGGGAGQGGANANTAYAGERVLAGSGSGGDINIPGERAEYYCRISGGIGWSGNGGSSVLGSGGYGQSSGTGSGSGSGGFGYGAGGGGGFAGSGSANRAGGAGGSGIIIIHEYY